MQEAFTVALLEPHESIGLAIISELERLSFVKRVLVYSRFDLTGNKFLFRGAPVSNAPLDTLKDPGNKLLIYCGDDNSYHYYRSNMNFEHQWMIDASGGAFEPQMLFFDQMDLDQVKEVKLPHPIAYQYTLLLDLLHAMSEIKKVNLFAACAVSTSGSEAISDLVQQTRAVLSDDQPHYRVFPKQMAFNCLPHVFSGSEISHAKLKQIILEQIRFYFSNVDFEIDLSMIQVPVFRGHTLISHVECHHAISINQLKKDLMSHSAFEIVASPNPVQYSIFKSHIHIGEIIHHPSNENAISVTTLADEFGFGVGAPLRALLVQKYCDIVNL